MFRYATIFEHRGADDVLPFRQNMVIRKVHTDTKKMKTESEGEGGTKRLGMYLMSLLSDRIWCLGKFTQTNKYEDREERGMIRLGMYL